MSDTIWPNQRWRHALEATGLSLALYAIVFFPQWRYGFGWSDEGLLWYLSERIGYGQWPIRDFFGYDPGRYIWTATWFRLLGGDGLFELRLANACFGSIGLIGSYLALVSAGIGRPVRIAVLVLLAIALGFPLHKVYEQSWSLIAIALLAHALWAPGVARRWFVLGIATGIAAIFGRNMGVYFVLAGASGLAIAWRLGSGRGVVRETGWWIGGTLLGYAPMIVWFILDGRFRDAMIQSILFTTQWQLPLPIGFPWRVAQSPHSVASIQAMAVSWLCVAVFATYAIALSGVLRTLAKRASVDRLFLLEAAALCVGIPWLQQAFDRADFNHIAQGILPLFIILAARFHRNNAMPVRIAVAAVACIALIAWIPSEPLIAATIAEHVTPRSQVGFTIDGRKFIINRGQARVLALARGESDRCGAGPGQLLAMPYYPGILAYLHARSPYWEMYYLYHRSADFQKAEIAAMEAAGTRIAIINETTAMDGQDSLRIGQTNPSLLAYIDDHFQRLPARADNAAGFEFFERDCAR